MHDVFISYCHKDNDDPQGWIDSLHEALEARLSKKRSVRIFRDRNQDSTTDVAQILDELRVSRILLCVVSTSFVESSNCLEEVEWFARECGPHRILAVESMPVPWQQLPAELQKKVRLERFYTTQGGFPRELLRCDNEYAIAIAALADQIEKCLDFVPRGKILNLAASKRGDEARRACDALRQRGYDVFTRKALYGFERERKAQLTSLIGSVDLTILWHDRDESEDCDDVKFAFEHLQTTAVDPSSPRMRGICIVPAERRDTIARIERCAALDRFVAEEDDLVREIERVIENNRPPTLYLADDGSEHPQLASLNTEIQNAKLRVLREKDNLRLKSRVLGSSDGWLGYLSARPACDVDRFVDSMWKARGYMGRDAMLPPVGLYLADPDCRRPTPPRGRVFQHDLVGPKECPEKNIIALPAFLEKVHQHAAMRKSAGF